MLHVTPSIQIEERELEESFIRASGPGGQNVNKVATAVQLRFNALASSALPERVKERLPKVAGRKLTEAGELIIEAKRYRTQERNREDARERLAELLREAAAPPPKPRKATRPSKGAKERRLKAKAKRSATKSRRGSVSPHD